MLRKKTKHDRRPKPHVVRNDKTLCGREAIDLPVLLCQRADQPIARNTCALCVAKLSASGIVQFDEAAAPVHPRGGAHALHVARGGRTFCHADTAGLKLQGERDPVTDLTCKRCLPTLLALRVVELEPKLDPLDTLTAKQQSILDELRASAKQEGWQGYVPHKGADSQALNRLVRLGLAVPTGKTITYKRRDGRSFKTRKVPTFMAVDRAEP